MTDKENAYLVKYRELSQRKNQVDSMVRSFSAICTALKDWQATTEDLGSISSRATLEEWSDETLGKLSGLRKDIIYFHQTMADLAKMWTNLSPEEKVGLAEPATLKPAAK